ncbi:MAG: hypothetical protein OEY49_04665 [Candidatus Heimdallarchaeota archaeon]|nr:hypothetical protein [Candidatus Heimdallarchaeota archaeon]
MTIAAWAPSHATLFFAVPAKFENPVKMGSIGGGFNFRHGVITRISDGVHENTVYWNDKQIEGQVTKTAIRLFKQFYQVEGYLTINHSSDIPIGFGLSTSGAGAIGTVLCLDRYFNTNGSQEDLFQIAHEAELLNKTGLGSVVGQITSHIELRMTQGGPKVCETKSFLSDETLILALLGPLNTSDVLKSEVQMNQVTISGLSVLEEAVQITDNHLIKFIRLGKRFSLSCGLLTERLNSLILSLESIGEMHVCMAMIGEALIICPTNITSVINLLKEMNINFIETNITHEKPKLLEPIP